MKSSPVNISLAAAALIGGLLLTLLSVYETRRYYSSEAQRQFDHLVGQMSTDVRARMTQPDLGLKGLRSLYAVSKSVDRLKFREYVDTLEIKQEFPGVLGFGFIERVLRKDLNAFVAAERADHAPDYTVKTTGNADDLYLIKYIDPLADNTEAWGYDVGSEAMRRETVERSIETGEAALTGRITLVQDETKRPGFLYLLPVYHGDSNPTTPEERVSSLNGLVYVPVVIDHVFDQLIERSGGLLDVEVFEGRVLIRDNLLYDADNIMVSAAHINGEHTFGERMFHNVESFYIGGQEWTLVTTTTPAFDEQVKTYVPAMVGVGGFALVILLAGLVLNLGTSRSRAQALAQKVTEDLHSSEDEARRLAMVASRTSNAVAITDSGGRIEWVNEGFTRITGYTIDEVKDRVPGSFLQGPLTDPETVKLMSKGLKSGEGFKTEILNYHKDGHTYWLDIEVKPLYSEAGYITGYMAIESDITERKETEEALLDNEQRLSALTREVPGVIFQFEVDPEGKRSFTFFSDAYRELFGRDPKDVLARPGVLLTTVHEEDRRMVKKSLDESITSGSPWIQVFRIRRPDNSIRWIDARSTSSCRMDGTKYWYGVLNNITELQDARYAAEDAMVKAEQANIAKGQFLAMMSHEIRTPMNGVIGMTSLLLDTELNNQQREFAEIVRSSGENLLTLINDILDFSKIESGKLDLEMAVFSVRECVEGALDLFAHKAAHHGIDLLYEISDDVPAEVSSDITRLRQIIVNLIGNALKFTEKGEIELNVRTVQDDERNKELIFSVRDTGIGIPADGIDKLFLSFSQVDASTTRKYGGTGLGLAISKRLAELMGGRMWVESKEGVGSTFLFTIKPEWIAPKARRYVSADRPSLRGKKILIVDDSLTSQRILTTLVTKWEMSPVVVGSGDEALSALDNQGPFDLALLDMQMPEMDGAMLAQHIRKREDTKKIPLILLSSIGQYSEGNEEDIFDSILTKPAKPSQIFDAIVHVLGSTVPAEIKAPASSAPIINPNEVHSERILMAEDNTVNQKVALHMLARLGYRADTVSNGLEAVEAVRNIPYDVILMDVQMPEMDGLQATRSIRAKQSADKPAPWIIALTANAMEGDREMCLEAGMDDYLGKPIKSTNLANALIKARKARESAES